MRPIHGNCNLQKCSINAMAPRIIDSLGSGYRLHFCACSIVTWCIAKLLTSATKIIQNGLSMKQPFCLCCELACTYASCGSSRSCLRVMYILGPQRNTKVVFTSGGSHQRGCFRWSDTQWLPYSSWNSTESEYMNALYN